MQKQFMYFGAALAVALAVSNACFALRPIPAKAEQSPALSPIIISAVQISGGPSKTHQDFVELYNPNSQPVNLNGYRLVKRTSTGVTDSSIKSWTADNYIPAYSFYLWANSAYSDIAVLPDSTTTATLADDNGIALRAGANDTGAIIDSLAWGSASNAFAGSGLANPSAGESVVRLSMSEPKVYVIKASSPRNTSVILLPESFVPQVPAAEEPLPEEPALEQPVSDEPATEELPVEDPPAPEPPPAEELPADEQQTSEQPVLDTPTVEQARTIQITELLPNPIGADSGYEQIELHNYGESVVDLNNWVLDDVAEDQPLSSNSYLLTDLKLEPDQYAALIIPAGKFTLNNSSGDIVSLFDDKGEAVDSAAYVQSAPSRKSYSKIGEEWVWVSPTLGMINVLEPEALEETIKEEEQQFPSIQGLIISEVYPAPAKGEQEFVELYNTTNQAIDLSGGIIMIGDSRASLPSVVLSANNYFLLRGENLTLALANSGKKISLLQKQEGTAMQNSATVFSVQYPKAATGQSYAKFEDNFLWTASVTPMSANALEQPQAPESRKPASKKQSASVKQTIKASSSKAKAKVSVKKSNSKPETKQADKAAKKSGLTDRKTFESAKHQEQDAEGSKSKSRGLASIMAIAIASLGAGGLAVYRFGMGGGMPF